MKECIPVIEWDGSTRVARVGAPGDISSASGRRSRSLPPEPCSSTTGGLAGSLPGRNRWARDAWVMATPVRDEFTRA